MPGKDWSKNEDRYLRRFYPTKGPRHCSKQLGRTQYACESRARRLGIESGLPTGWIPLTWVEPESCRSGPTNRILKLARQEGVLRYLPNRAVKNLVPEWWAIEYANRAGQAIELDRRTSHWLTTGDLARMTGASRPTLNRAIHAKYGLGRHLQHVESVMIHRPRTHRRWHPLQARMAVNAWRANRRAA